MELELFLLVMFCIGFAIVMAKLSEIDAKINIVMTSNTIDWSLHFNEEVNKYIHEGNFAKASMALRKKTGLSLKFCLDVIQDHQSKVA